MAKESAEYFPGFVQFEQGSAQCVRKTFMTF